jgi:hypothetical protein
MHTHDQQQRTLQIIAVVLRSGSFARELYLGLICERAGELEKMKVQCVENGEAISNKQVTLCDVEHRSGSEEWAQAAVIQ